MDEKNLKYINLVNAWWRPILAISIVVSVVLVYVIYPISYMILSTKGVHLQLPPNFQNALNSLLISGGVLAALRTIEKMKGVSQNH